MSIISTLLKKIAKLNAGEVFCANDFCNLGSSGAIDVNLHRLAKSGVIRRLGYGLYDKPRRSVLLGDLTPDIAQIIRAYSRRMGQAITLDPQGAANTLSLTTQVPAQMTFLTDGKSHIMHIRGIDIRLIHASPKKLAGAGTRIGIIIQALRYYGKAEMPKKSFQFLIKHLSGNDINALKAIRKKTLRQIVPHIDRILAHA
jgi:hypothetical protein